MNISCPPVLLAEKYSLELASYDRFIKIFTSSINLVLSVPISLLNMLILWTIFKNPSLQTPSYIFIFSLALADFATGLLLVPYDSSWKITLLAADTDVNVCGWYFTVGFSTTFAQLSASELTVTALSVDRYLAIRLGPRYRVLVTTSRVIKVVFILWSVAAVWGITSVLLSPRVVHGIVVVLGGGTFVVICVCYFLSYKALFALESKTNYARHLDRGKEERKNEKLQQKLQQKQQQSNKRKVFISKENYQQQHTNPKSIRIKLKKTANFVSPEKHLAVVQSATSTVASRQNISGPFHNTPGTTGNRPSILEVLVSEEARLNKGTCSKSSDQRSSVSNHGNDLVQNNNQPVPKSLTAERSFPKVLEKHLDTTTSAGNANYKHQTDLAANNRGGHGNSRQFQNRNLKVKLVKYRHTMVTLSCVIVLFMFCYAAYFLLSFAVVVIGMTKELAVIWSCTITCLCFNSLLNPIIYFYRFRDLKKGCGDTLKKLCKF